MGCMLVHVPRPLDVKIGSVSTFQLASSNTKGWTPREQCTASCGWHKLGQNSAPDPFSTYHNAYGTPAEDAPLQQHTGLQSPASMPSLHVNLLLISTTKLSSAVITCVHIYRMDGILQPYLETHNRLRTTEHTPPIDQNRLYTGMPCSMRGVGALQHSSQCWRLLPPHPNAREK